MDNPDTVTALHGLEMLGQFAKKHHDKELELEAELITTYYLFKHSPKNTAWVTSHFEQVIKHAIENKNLQVQARSYHLFANYYWDAIGNYELAFEQYFHLEKVLDQIPEETFPDKLNHLYQIGFAYYAFSDYRQAIRYFEKALSIKPTAYNRNSLMSARNTLGLCYESLQQLDSAEYHFKQIVLADISPVWNGIAKGNLGYNYYLQGNYTDAIPLLKADVEQALKDPDWGLASGSTMTLADIYFKQGKLAEAKMLTMKAKEYVTKSGQYKRYQYLYPLMSKMYTANGQLGLAYAYMDSAFYVKDSLARRFNALQVTRAQQKNELRNHQEQLATIENQKKVKTVERNALIAVMLILLVVALYIYRNQRKKYVQQQEIANIQLKEKERELAAASVQLEDFAKNISEKNRLLETLQQQLGMDANNEALLQLQKSTILTDEEWEKFRTVFEKVHGGYLNRLKIKLPELSPAETRFMVLAKLQLSNKEMAGTLGVSQQAIRTTWHRLRRKLNLPEEGSLEELVSSI